MLAGECCAITIIIIFGQTLHRNSSLRQAGTETLCVCDAFDQYYYYYIYKHMSPAEINLILARRAVKPKCQYGGYRGGLYLLTYLPSPPQSPSHLFIYWIQCIEYKGSNIYWGVRTEWSWSMLFADRIDRQSARWWMMLINGVWCFKSNIDFWMLSWAGVVGFVVLQ